jgi:hypothetical protein
MTLDELKAMIPDKGECIYMVTHVFERFGMPNGDQLTPGFLKIRVHTNETKTNRYLAASISWTPSPDRGTFKSTDEIPLAYATRIHITQPWDEDPLSPC